MLKKVADQVVLVFDDDAAGHKATIRTAGIFLAEEMPVRVVSLPEGDDPDSYLRKHPKEDFQRLLDDAESILSFQVRVERAKEAKPDSIDAVARVTKALIGTIAHARNAVIRASMVAEAAKLTGLPSAALAEELQKVKLAPVRQEHAPVAASETSAEEAFDEAGEETPFDGDDSPLPGEDAADAATPSDLEMALCEFLMSNEYDKELDGLVGEFLPPGVFAHEFTARFVETWRSEVASGTDMMREFVDGLSERARAWFERIYLGSGKTLPCPREPEDILREFVRAIWGEFVRRERGELPAVGDAEAEIQRMKLTMDLKRLTSVDWESVKAIIRDRITHAKRGDQQ